MMGNLSIREEAAGFTTALLDEPSRRNAVDAATVSAILRAVDESPGPVLVLGSTDARAFSSGVGLHLDDRERSSVSDSLYALYEAMRRSPKIIVAAATGNAVGAGAQLLIASDIRFGSPSLVVRFAGAGHGLAVGAWGLPALVGRGRALDLCLSMRPVEAEEALVIGLVDRVVDDPLELARKYASMICDLDPATVRKVKEIVSISDSISALERERRLNSDWDGAIPA